MAGSHGSSVFSVLRTLRAVLHSGRASSHSHQQCRRVPHSLDSPVHGVAKDQA